MVLSLISSELRRVEGSLRDDVMTEHHIDDKVCGKEMVTRRASGRGPRYIHPGHTTSSKLEPCTHLHSPSKHLRLVSEQLNASRSIRIRLREIRLRGPRARGT